MKYLLISAMLCLGVQAHQSGISHKISIYWNECLLEQGTTKEEMRAAIINKEGMHTLGCVSACIGEKLQMLGEDGIILPEKVNDFFEHVSLEKGVKMSDPMRKYIEECAADANSSSKDHCDISMNFIICLKAHVTSHIFS